MRPVHDDATLGDLLIARTDGHHGTGEIGEQMAPVSGFVLHAPGEPSVYIAGDTILCDEVLRGRRGAPPGDDRRQCRRRAVQRGRPDRDGPTTTCVALARAVPDARIVAIHFDTRLALAPRPAPTCALA